MSIYALQGSNANRKLCERVANGAKLTVPTERLEEGGVGSGGSVRSRAKIRQNHNGWCLMDVEESLHLVGWRET